MELLKHLYLLALDASFWLVIGLFIGGLFKTLIPTELLQRHLSGEGFASILKAAILGAPLPLCSCGVIPAAMGLREAGASKSATTSFLVSTPETGVDSVTITYAMMGPFMAIVRPISAIVSAVVTGSLVVLFDNDEYKASEKVDSCCSSKAQEPSAKKESVASCCESEPTKDDCCSKEQVTSSSCCDEKVDLNKSESVFSNIISGIKYAFTDLLDNIIFWLVIGLIFAAVIQTFADKEWLIEYGSGWTGMLVMLVVGIPMYVCATASTPLAAGFLLAGISPGAVLVFLLAGPATNVATLGVIQQQLGKKTMVLYLTGIMTTALGSGMIVNWLVTLWSIDTTQHLDATHNHIPMILQGLALILLIVLSLRRFIPKFSISK
jgi:uncharacterized membrane protein YraQ (UPF0718 family)